MVCTVKCLHCVQFFGLINDIQRTSWFLQTLSGYSLSCTCVYVKSQSETSLMLHMTKVYQGKPGLSNHVSTLRVSCLHDVKGISFLNRLFECRWIYWNICVFPGLLCLSHTTRELWTCRGHSPPIPNTTGLHPQCSRSLTRWLGCRSPLDRQPPQDQDTVRLHWLILVMQVTWLVTWR